jgi:signal transduction histidine kinase
MTDEHNPSAGESGHILVVDDNRMNRLKLSRGLEQQGHTVALAENGRQALDMLGAQSFDVVLLDIMMPEMDGYQVLAKIKGDHRLRDIPVIVISALDEMDSVVRCIEMGAEDSLPKPFNPVLLRARLNASLQKKKLRDLERAYVEQEVMLRQSEKLATLGRLSAGMAHELNNPAAAAQRGAGQLRAAIEQRQAAHLALDELALSAVQVATLRNFDQVLRTRAGEPDDLDLISRSDRENQVEGWLETRGFANAWELAPELVSLDFGPDELTQLDETFSAAQLPHVLAWMVGGFTIYSVLDEIGEGAGRIAEIVKALKAYTYLDQSPVQNVDVHQGLDNTLVMLRGKLRQGITVHREYAEQLPAIEAFGSELNQVWTNIIDNAAAAMNGHGEIWLRTSRDGEWVVVEIMDNGPGIPAEIQAHIFDPFFTTKAPGEGTGLGLNISHNIVVQKHGGAISVDSEPGRTRFRVSLPIELVNGEPEAQ